MALILQSLIARLIALVVTLLTALAAGNLIPVVPPTAVPSSAAPTSATPAVDPSASPTAVPTTAAPTEVPPVPPTASPTVPPTAAPTPTAPAAELASARLVLLPAGVDKAEYLVVEATDSAGVQLAWPGYRYENSSWPGVRLTVRPATGQLWYVTASGDPGERDATENDLSIGIGTPCNSMSGFALAEGSTLVAGPFMATMMYCMPDKWMEAEDWLSGFLNGRSTLEVSRTADGNVQLADDRGTLVLAPLG